MKYTKSKLFKFISIILILGITTNYFFGGLVRVSAATYRVATADLWFRSKPTTKNNDDGSSNAIGEILTGSIVELLEEKVNGSNWARIKYNGQEGYVYGTYLGDPGNDIYDRPWNTPKKAIVGGAKWISYGYISRGQFTSYLKKYNVNPNADSALFNHQYMANIHAPSSEAKTSYNAYLKNGLLNLGLVFNIPVYTGMADKYDSPAGNIDTVQVIENVGDVEFETLLDKEGFPETYKKALRYLHKIHPNWTFQAMQTNLDFTYVVNCEKGAGATQYSALYERDENGNPIKVEPGWYQPNFSGTAYYMDPRNFLTEKYILQFEALNYNELYTEDAVQTILNNTFMEGNSNKDNQSYKSIFVEAGKTANISPIYLASLAKQESGTKGSIATTGETLEYDGKTYQSVFNFFNIGAVSSASNPVREGIKYATGGYCTICGDYTPPVNPDPTPDNPTPEPVPEPEQKVSYQTSMNNLGVKLLNNYVRGFNVGTSIDSLKNSDVYVTYSDTDIIKTGTVLNFDDGSSYTSVLLGDLSGDGKINSADILKIRLHLLNTNPLSGAYKEAADINGDGKINSADLLLIRQYLLGQTNIKQI
ncbi:MAG TPA: hypothetical protein DHU33_04630 [Firmicutes bacterium]|nr:hypothetical protein [Bacillota bacterium]